MSFHWPTFFFQVVNFFVLVFVLKRLLWRPLRKHMTKRSDEIEAQLESIASEQKKFKARSTEIDAAFKRAKEAEAEALERAEREAESRRAQLVEEAKRTATEERDRILARVKVEQREKEAAFLRSLAPELSQVLTSLLRELAPGTDLHEQSCRRLTEHLYSGVRQGHLSNDSAAQEDRVTVSSATGDIPSGLMRALLDRGAKEGSVRVEKDPKLIAGACLRIGDHVFDGSIRAQVEGVLASLREGHP